MVAKLKIDPKDLAGKSEDEKLIYTCGLMLEELEKSALERDNEGIATLRKEIEDMRAGLEERQAQRNPQFSLPGVEYDADGTRPGKAFSLARAACAVKSGEWAGAGYEKEAFDQAEKAGMRQKALNAGVDIGAGFFVSSEISKRIIEKLQPGVISFLLGVEQVGMGSVGSMTFNRETGVPTATWVGEQITAAESNQKYKQMMVSPKAISAKVSISNLLQMLAGGADGAESRFLNSCIRQMRLGYDRAILIGATSQEGPIGIANTPNVQRASTATLTLNKLIAFPSKLRKADALVGDKLGWAMTPEQLEFIETMLDATNQPIVRRAIDGGTLDKVRGYPYATSTQMGTTGINTMIFGAWDLATFFQWFGGFVMRKTDTSDTALDTDSTRIVLRGYGDVGVEQPTAFVVAED